MASEKVSQRRRDEADVGGGLVRVGIGPAGAGFGRRGFDREGAGVGKGCVGGCRSWQGIGQASLAIGG